MTRHPRLLALFVVLTSATVCVWDAWRSHGQSLYGYLAAFGFVATTALGGLVLVMAAHAAGARWFVALRRLAEALALGVSGLVVFFVPLALGARALYPWAQPFSSLAASPPRLLTSSGGWTSWYGFTLRGLICLGAWSALAELLRRASLLEDRAPNPTADLTQRRLSALGLPMLGFTGTLAAFDWFMAAVPGWRSTILGLYLLTGGFASAMGVVSIALFFTRRRGELPPEIGRAHALAIGRLLLMSICLWAYMAVSQLVISWSANLPHEAAFYLTRFRGLFRLLALALVLGHFALPFCALLSRGLKQRPDLLACLGGWVVLMHALDLYWLLAPTSARGPSWFDVAPFALQGTALLLFGVWRFRRAPAFSPNAAHFARSLAYESP
jgi:hypothetical protein